MPSFPITYELPSGATKLAVKENQVEYGFIGALQKIKYEYEFVLPDIFEQPAKRRCRAPAA